MVECKMCKYCSALTKNCKSHPAILVVRGEDPDTGEEYHIDVDVKEMLYKNRDGECPDYEKSDNFLKIVLNYLIK